MKLCVFVLSLAFDSAFAQTHHVLHYVVGCFFDDAVKVIFEFDGDLGAFVDFENNDIVVTVPPYVPINISQYPNLYRNAKKAEKACLLSHAIVKTLLNESDTPDVQDPPESILYPADEVLNEVENTLICFVYGFFPPHVNVTWTKNDHPVSEGVTFSSYMLNGDQTFYYFATLPFIPVDGDVYSCTVEHSALDTPKTKIWDVDLGSPQDLALDLYCGLGLTVAFVGVAIGTFLIVKGRYGH